MDTKPRFYVAERADHDTLVNVAGRARLASVPYYVVIDRNTGEMTHEEDYFLFGPGTGHRQPVALARARFLAKECNRDGGRFIDAAE